ncbi:MAG: transglycosylase SLT domain-containing protein [Patescibacteria group bacterium]|jgi:soluble lytic murein transglycosylase-like protein
MNRFFEGKSADTMIIQRCIDFFIGRINLALAMAFLAFCAVMALGAWLGEGQVLAAGIDAADYRIRRVEPSRIEPIDFIDERELDAELLQEEKIFLQQQTASSGELVLLNQSVEATDSTLIDSKLLPPQEIINVYAAFIQRDNPRVSDAEANKWARDFEQWESRYNFPRGVLVAIAHTESWHDPNAKSCAEAYGLMQVQYGTGQGVAKRFGLWSEPKFSKPAKNEKEARERIHQVKKFRENLIKILKDPEHNIRMGAFVLHRFLVKEKGDWSKALARYSGGAKNYEKKVKKFHAVVRERIELRAKETAPTGRSMLAELSCSSSPLS